MIHRENGDTLGMVPLIINPIYTSIFRPRTAGHLNHSTGQTPRSSKRRLHPRSRGPFGRVHALRRRFMWLMEKEIRRENQLRLISYPVIYQVFLHLRWSFGISEPSTVWRFGFAKGHDVPKKVNQRYWLPNGGVFDGVESHGIPKATKKTFNFEQNPRWWTLD